MELLAEADKKGDGVVSEGEFTDAMCNIIRKSLRHVKKKIDEWASIKQLDKKIIVEKE